MHQEPAEAEPATPLAPAAPAPRSPDAAMDRFAAGDLSAFAEDGFARERAWQSRWLAAALAV
jgi:hypothetical protein